jgi:putative transposase
MPVGLRRYQHARQLHYISFTCYHRAPHLNTPSARDTFEQTLERVRRWYGFYISGYVVMPEHVHLLVSEPERAELSTAIQMLKQIVSRKLHGKQGASLNPGWPTLSPGFGEGWATAKGGHTEEPFWQRRYYDFNVWSDEKFTEKLRYIHRNPVRRGLVERPEDWRWSSFRHYLTGIEGTVQIESQWTARKRERLGIVPQLRRRQQK